MQVGELLVPVVNFGQTDVCLNPLTCLVCISVADVVAGGVSPVAILEVGP